MERYGLYIHVPFCRQKCAYCSFVSQPLNNGLAERWIEALKLELQQLPRPLTPATIYIGGGTPSALPTPLFEKLLNILAAELDAPPAEWTCEVNPGTIDAAKAHLIAQSGVNRVSLGAQSADDQCLHNLGRCHDMQQTAEAVALLRSYGIENISLDLIYGLPDGWASPIESLEHFLTLAPQHLSTYCLSYEPGTPLHSKKESGHLTAATDERCAEEYEQIRERMKEAGFKQYELSNFCLPGKASRHNILYWNGAPWHACGPAAHGHWNNTRHGNEADLKTYIQCIAEHRSAKTFEEILTPENRARELLMTQLRLTYGCSEAAFKKQTGFNYNDLCGEAIPRLTADGWLDTSNHRLRLTPKAYFVSNAILAELL